MQGANQLIRNNPAQGHLDMVNVGAGESQLAFELH